MQRCVRRYQLVDALNAEWDRLLAHDPRPAFCAAAPTGPMAGCRGLEDVLGTIRCSPDPALGFLLSAATDGDVTAARVVLQAMLGKVVVMASRDPYAGVDDYVSAMWVRIRTYPLAQRPTSIAANLALDTLKTVKRDQGSITGAEVTPYPPAAFVEALYAPPVAEQLEDLSASRVIASARTLGLVNAVTSEILLSVYADGLSGREAAARHHMSPGAIRTRCSTALRHLSRHAYELVDAS